MVPRFGSVDYATLQKPEITVWPCLMNLFLPKNCIDFAFMELQW